MRVSTASVGASTAPHDTLPSATVNAPAPLTVAVSGMAVLMVAGNIILSIFCPAPKYTNVTAAAETIPSPAKAEGTG